MATAEEFMRCMFALDAIPLTEKITDTDLMILKPVCPSVADWEVKPKEDEPSN